jgi:hypothetical protein
MGWLGRVLGAAFVVSAWERERCGWFIPAREESRGREATVLLLGRAAASRSCVS